MMCGSFLPRVAASCREIWRWMRHVADADAADRHASPFDAQVIEQGHAAANPLVAVLAPRKDQHFAHRLAGLVRASAFVSVMDDDGLIIGAASHAGDGDCQRAMQELLAVELVALGDNGVLRLDMSDIVNLDFAVEALDHALGATGDFQRLDVVAVTGPFILPQALA